ncbi:TetR/AcrR family transcriptional regulator [Aquipuribacter sp. SD81]|uniref:TetR/AcrR family transcriptional regulator n=1 Tax=Aquipuribacter sp. SD81 TaxID=3127703 RepID=UPI00301B3688
MDVKASRPYRMTARARAAERTGERVVDAMLERFSSTPYDRIRLEDVAADADVTVQTVVRRFGSKHGLLAATVERELSRLAADREDARGADARATVRSLVQFYEHHGLLILKLYAEAHQAPGVPELADRARAYHVRWCGDVFAGPIARVTTPTARAVRAAQVVALCDASTWRVLRVDGGLSARQTERAVLEMLLPLVE